MFSFHQ